MRKTYKIILACILMILIIFSLGLEVNAAFQKNAKAVDMAKKFADGSSDGTTDVSSKVEKILGSVVNAVRVAASGVAAIMIFAVAIKYLSAAPGDRADIKKHAVVYVVGAMVLFGASGILTIISSLAGLL